MNWGFYGWGMSVTTDSCPTRRTLDDDQAPAERTGSLASRLNWLRAAVLGANDGIVSIAGLVIGVAVVDPTNRALIALAGLSGIASAASSMAVGEYVSVSTQRDTEREVVARQRRRLAADPAGEQRALARAYVDRGLSAETALRVARELSERDALGAHLAARYHLDEDDLTNPWHAAAGSFVAFLAGSALPMLAILLFPPRIAVSATIGAVVLALALTGVISAALGDAPKGRAAVRLVVGGAVAMGLGYAIGHAFGTGMIA